MTYTIDLEGRRALVTGAGQGVGRAISLTLASAGAAVVVNDYIAERAENVVGEIRAAGGKADAAPFDVTDYQAVTSAVAANGAFDILVNNAGNAGTARYTMNLFQDTEPEEWQPYFGVNLYGVMYCTRAVLPGMIDRGATGRIITIVSDAGRAGEPRLAAYAAAKAGAAGFMRALARDVGRYMITANCVALGTIDSVGRSRPDAEVSAEAAEQMKQRLRPYIIRRLGRPDDVAGLVAFLASDHSSWITGQTYPVNGGYTVNQ